ncbi:MAG: DeoR/GlpR transcriptional regulator [Clostridia bacterium]|nr:DeoR/GlpR transcriptional regulator [Clostridia bacterium]
MLSTEQRRNEIVSLLHAKGKIKVSEIAEKYGISEVSVRKDLEYLEMQGHLSRVHGGAVALNKLYINMDLSERYKTNSVAKKRLAKLAATLIEDNDTIMMNAGTTLSYFLHALQGKKNITIVTNSIQNAMGAALFQSFNVILLGGEFDSKYQFTYGEDALSQLENYHATKCILSVDGVSMDTGLSLYYSNEASVARKMIECSEKLIVAADGTKFGKNAFVKITDLTPGDVLVTNFTENRSEAEKITQAGITLLEAR